MKTSLFLLCFAFIPPIIMYSQLTKQPRTSEDLVFGKCENCSVLLYINGVISDKTLNLINPDTIGAMLAEGDSSYVRRKYGEALDTSLIHEYFGDQRDRGIFFVFTNDRVKTISNKELVNYVKNEKGRILFKIDNEPLTSTYHYSNANKIQMVRDFLLTHWDTGKTESFTLFVMKSLK